MVKISKQMDEIQKSLMSLDNRLTYIENISFTNNTSNSVNNELKLNSKSNNNATFMTNKMKNIEKDIGSLKKVCNIKDSHDSIAETNTLRYGDIISLKSQELSGYIYSTGFSDNHL
jgi:hypothetical protein